MTVRRRTGTVLDKLLPCPFLLILAACWPHPGGVSGPSASATVGDVSPWTVSVESPIDPAGRAADGLDPSSAPHAEDNGSLGSTGAAPPPAAALAGGGAAPAAHGGEVGAAPATTSTNGSHKLQAGLESLPDDPDLAGLTLEQQVVSLRSALTAERQRRHAVEQQLQKLREETSVPPFGPAMVPQGELLAAKQEIVYLRQKLEEERSARQKLAEDLLALQDRLAQQPPADRPDLRAQHEALEVAQRAAAASFTQSFKESQAASAKLDDRFAAAAAAAADGDMITMRAENTALRGRLEDQYRRTLELAEKLKVATRVADLIFKMEAQPAEATPPDPAPRPAASRVTVRPMAPANDGIPPAPVRAVDRPALRPAASEAAAEEPLVPRAAQVQPTRTATSTPRRVAPPTPTPTLPLPRTPRSGPAPVSA
jgi:hypothetical protein